MRYTLSRGYSLLILTAKIVSYLIIKQTKAIGNVALDNFWFHTYRVNTKPKTALTPWINSVDVWIFGLTEISLSRGKKSTMYTCFKNTNDTHTLRGTHCNLFSGFLFLIFFFIICIKSEFILNRISYGFLQSVIFIMKCNFQFSLYLLVSVSLLVSFFSSHLFYSLLFVVLLHCLFYAIYF